MLHVGGEQELAQVNYFRELTNSGRSSLRWIIESAQLKHKRLLLPDFLCDVIFDVLAEYHISVEFYEVDRQFGYQLPDDLSRYDALYLIKYFGAVTDSFELALSTFKQCIIVDDVFSPYPHVLELSQPWYSFNSLRKISAVADLSMLYSNQAFAAVEVAKLSEFAELKNQAKQCKYDYFNSGVGSEKKFLALFAQGESCLDENKGIFSPSTNSVLESINFYNKLEQEKQLRCKNYGVVREKLAEYLLPITTDSYSFAIIFLSDRDVIRQKLMAHNVFLAVHWPEVDGISNQLSRAILSIPLDSRYSTDDMGDICQYILNQIK